MKIKKLKNIFKRKNLKKEEVYSTIFGAGSFVPCQMEAYFLCMNKYIPINGTSLDVGFGLGYGINTMSIKAKEVSGVEIDQQVYNYCQMNLVGKNPKIKSLSIYNGINLEFADNHFDIVSCVDVLEHVEEYDKLLREMIRVSKIGVFISTPNRRPEYTSKDGSPKNHWHLREWSRDELDTILKKHGKVEWNLLNGKFEGPFTISSNEEVNTLTLSPFIFKNND